MVKKMKSIIQPPKRWFTTCIDTGEDMAAPDVNIKQMCTILWNEKPDEEKAKIILENKEYHYPRKTREIEYGTTVDIPETTITEESEIKEEE